MDKQGFHAEREKLLTAIRKVVKERESDFNDYKNAVESETKLAHGIIA
jgi:predicted nucleic acid-binding OB-fold protein